MALPASIRQTHRVIATVWLLFLGITLALEATGGPESPFVTIPLVALLVVLVFTGGFLLLSPWYLRYQPR